VLRPIATAVIALSLSSAPLFAQAAAPKPTSPPDVLMRGPEIFFRSPADGATVSATFPVVFGLRNYGVAPAGVNVTGAGHFHVLINKEAPANGVVIPPNDSSHKHFGNGAIETTLTLAPGKYTLRLVLGDFEHKVINANLVSKPITVTVK
jgi:hypothetical protein